MRPWRVLVVDDDPKHRDQVRQALEKFTHAQAPNGFVIEMEGDFDRASIRMKTERFDFAVLDIRKDAAPTVPAAGVQALRGCRNDAFIPTVFYSAVPQQADEDQTVFVLVVDKKGGIEALTVAIGRLLDTRLIAFRDHIDGIQRSLLWENIPKFLDSTRADMSGAEASGLLARSLARQLGLAGTRKILGLDEELRHPVECYVLPAATTHPTTGDLYKCSTESQVPICYWVVLNPSCDLVKSHDRPAKVKEVLFAKCSSLDANADVQNWIQKEREAAGADKREKAWDKVEYILDNRRTDFHFLPGFGATPDLVADFRQLRLVPYDNLSSDSWGRIASLDSPYAEALNSRFTQFFARIGVPDIDLTVIRDRLQSPAVKPARA